MPAWSHTAAFKFAPIEGKARRSCVNACLFYGYGICLGAVASEPLQLPGQIAFADCAGSSENSPSSCADCVDCATSSLACT
jgi:hypothetical protein